MEKMIRAPRKMGRGNGYWHEEARQMRSEGRKISEIARYFDVTNAAVYFVFNPEKRHRKKVKTSDHWF